MLVSPTLPEGDNRKKENTIPFLDNGIGLPLAAYGLRINWINKYNLVR